MPKGYAVELYFDAALENQILKTWNVLARKQISTRLIETGARPNISLSVHPELQPSKLRTAMENFAQQQQPIAVSLASIGSFASADGILFFSPAPTTALLTLHEQFMAHDTVTGDVFNALPDIQVLLRSLGSGEVLKRLGIQSSGQYTPGMWFPHCMVAQEVPRERVAQAFSTLRDFRLPLTGHLCDIGLVEVWPVHEHYSFPLGGDML
eukprot:SM000088S23745  [mRNA]  locus=s88:531409:532731:+ [translate_table: standard]